MIVSDIVNINRQVPMTPAMRMAIDFLRSSDLQALPEGKTVIDGDLVFALVQRYETKAAGEPRCEYHRRYIDIQYLVSGEEVIGWAPAERMAVTDEYDAVKDICFGTVPKEHITRLYLQAGQLAVLYPDDAHAPGLGAAGSSPVKKIVIKIAVQQ